MFCEPFLNIGIIFAIFQSLGNLPFAKVISNKAFSGPATCNANSLSRTACRPSGPTDLFAFNAFRFFSIVSVDILILVILSVVRGVKTGTSSKVSFEKTLQN